MAAIFASWFFAVHSFKTAITEKIVCMKIFLSIELTKKGRFLYHRHSNGWLTQRPNWQSGRVMHSVQLAPVQPGLHLKKDMIVVRQCEQNYVPGTPRNKY